MYKAYHALFASNTGWKTDLTRAKRFCERIFSDLKSGLAAFSIQFFSVIEKLERNFFLKQINTLGETQPGNVSTFKIDYHSTWGIELM